MTMTINMDKVVRILKDEYDIHAYVEQTGGGTATIFAGELRSVERKAITGVVVTEDRWQAVAGPGWFEGPGWTNARGDVSDFYIGPDDDGEADPVMAEKTWSETDIARSIASVVNA